MTFVTTANLPLDPSNGPAFSQHERTRSLARFSWYSFVCAFAGNLLLSVFAPILFPSIQQTAININWLTFLVLGLPSGVIALCRVGRYDRKTVWPAAIGVGLWLLAFGGWLCAVASTMA